VSIQNIYIMGDEETGQAGDAPAAVTATEVKVLGTGMARMTLWALAVAASIMLVGPSAYSGGSGGENTAFLIFGCIGLLLGLACMAVEHTNSAGLDNQTILAILGFIFTGCGIASMLTLIFGGVETVTLAVGAAGLTIAGMALIGTEVEAIKTRLTTAGSSVRNGAHAVGLIVSLILYVIAASVGLEPYNGVTRIRGYSLAAAGVAIGVLCLVAALVGLFAGEKLGGAEKYMYLVMTLVLIIGASLFPMAAIGKGISAAVSLLAAVAFSGLITRKLFA
jgi:hypothetical protein